MTDKHLAQLLGVFRDVALSVTRTDEGPYAVAIVTVRCGGHSSECKADAANLAPAVTRALENLVGAIEDGLTGQRHKLQQD